MSHEWRYGEVFVFGSNLAGLHGRGAARVAYAHHAARWGQGVGPQGNAYAIPTKDAKLRPLPLTVIAEHVAAFINYASANPKQRFFVTRVGCGLAGYADNQMAPLFRGAPDNCRLPLGW